MTKKMLQFANCHTDKAGSGYDWDDGKSRHSNGYKRFEAMAHSLVPVAMRLLMKKPTHRHCRK